LRAGENVDEAAELVDLEPHLKSLKSEFDKLLKHGERMDTDPEFARKAEKRYAKYKTDDDLAIDDMESDNMTEGQGSGWYVTHEKRSGDPDNVAGPFADQQKAQAWMDDNLPMHLDDSGQYDIAQMEGVDEGLDANQKRAGQLGPTEKVKNNNIGKLVGANENFINTVDQAVVSEEDEMAESILSAIKKAGKKALDVVAPGDDELLNRLDKDVHGGKVPNRYNSDSESDEKHPADDELDRILQIMKHRR